MEFCIVDENLQQPSSSPTANYVTDNSGEKYLLNSVNFGSICDMSLVLLYEPRLEKTLFGRLGGGYKQVRLKTACSATDTSRSLEILDIENRDYSYDLRAAYNKGTI